MAGAVGRCWGCDKKCEGNFCDYSCITLFRDKHELNGFMPELHGEFSASRQPDRLTVTDVAPARATSTPTTTDSDLTSNHVRAYEATDGQWYVEFDLSYGLGKLYYKAGKWREAKRVTDLMKEHGTIMFYAEAQP